MGDACAHLRVLLLNDHPYNEWIDLFIHSSIFLKAGVLSVAAETSCSSTANSIGVAP